MQPAGNCRKLLRVDAASFLNCDGVWGVQLAAHAAPAPCKDAGVERQAVSGGYCDHRVAPRALSASASRQSLGLHLPRSGDVKITPQSSGREKLLMRYNSG